MSGSNALSIDYGVHKNLILFYYLQFMVKLIVYTKLSNWANKDMKRLQSNTGNGAGLDKHSVFRIQGAILYL